jgi:ribonuclease Z
MYPEIFKIPKYNLTVHGWSRGSQNTGFFIPELKLLLDTQSSCPFDPETILITHNHTDHCFSLPMRITCINTHPTILCPQETTQFLVDFVNATFRMGYNDRTYNTAEKFMGVLPGDIIPLKNNMLVKVYDMDHNIPCRGYGLNIVKTKLKQEYIGLNGKEIIELRKKNISITDEYIEPILAYLTDTTPVVFERDPELLKYPYIMVECTFLPIDPVKSEKEIQLAIEAKHNHWSFIHPIIKNNPTVTFVLIHFSHRYTDEDLMKFRDSITEKNVVFAI